MCRSKARLILQIGRGAFNEKADGFQRETLSPASSRISQTLSLKIPRRGIGRLRTGSRRIRQEPALTARTESKTPRPSRISINLTRSEFDL